MICTCVNLKDKGAQTQHIHHGPSPGMDKEEEKKKASLR